MYFTVTMRRVRPNIFAVEKEHVLLILSVCVCVWCVCVYTLLPSMQYACAILPSVACPAVQYFPTLSHKRHDLRKKSYWTQNVCLEFLYSFCLKHFPL